MTGKQGERDVKLYYNMSNLYVVQLVKAVDDSKHRLNILCVAKNFVSGVNSTTILK